MKSEPTWGRTLRSPWPLALEISVILILTTAPLVVATWYSNHPKVLSLLLGIKRQRKNQILV